MTSEAKLCAGLSPQHLGIAFEGRTFVQLLDDALDFFGANIVVEAREAKAFSPEQVDGPIYLFCKVFFGHVSRSYVGWRLPIKYTGFISTSRNFISENLKHLCLRAGRSALKAMECDNG